MHVLSGDVVKMRDGRIVEVTDAADRDPEAYPGDLPVETIFVGNQLDGGWWYNFGFKWDTGDNREYKGGRVVSDMSEVVSIVGGLHLE